MSASGPADGEPDPGANAGGIGDEPVLAGKTPIDGLDGGVSGRLVRRCRTAALILLALAALFLLVVALAGWGVVAALLAVLAGLMVVAALLLVRRSAVWSGVAGWLRVGAVGAGLPAPQGISAIVGQPRTLSPGATGAPVKRRLSSAVLPVHVQDGPSPGGGALIVHARADGATLAAGDAVLIWLAGNGGLISLTTVVADRSRNSPVRGRFVLFRESDGAIFLATTRVTDTF